MWGFFSRSLGWQPAEGISPEDQKDVDTSREETTETESTQTTPKASASVTAPPMLQVPQLSLDEGDKADRPDVVESTKSTTSQKSITNISSASLMPPPPRISAPKPKSRATTSPSLLTPPKPKASAPLRPPPSAAANLRNPAEGLTSSTLAPPQRSRKVILGPGYSPLDWATLSRDPRQNLRGADLPPTLIKVTPSMLKAHNGRKGADAWTSYNGKVYNVTQYLPFHPGGKGELLRGAGKDSAKLFLETHPWVNWDGILGPCLVGILVSEDEKLETNELDAMD